MAKETHKPFAATSGPSKTIVITIPGITGTPLYDALSHRVWPPNLTSIFSDFRAGHCDLKGESLEKLTPGLPMADYYELLPQRLEREGYRVIRFGYDWRIGTEGAALALHQLIQKIENQPQTIGLSTKPNINIIAHSLGGLVSLRYLERFGPSKINHLVTLGTPYLGTPGAFKTLDKGDFADGITGYFLRPYFIELFRNHRSWYELLPTRDFFEVVAPSYITVSPQKTLKGFSETMDFIKTRPWANQLFVKELHSDWSMSQKLALLKKVDAYFIIGERQPTTGGILCDPGPPMDCEAQVDHGDGAVVLQSARMGGRLDEIHPGHSYYIDEHHGQLFNNPYIIDQIVHILRGNPMHLPPFSREPHKTPTRSLH